MKGSLCPDRSANGITLLPSRPMGSVLPRSPLTLCWRQTTSSPFYRILSSSPCSAISTSAWTTREGTRVKPRANINLVIREKQVHGISRWWKKQWLWTLIVMRPIKSSSRQKQLPLPCAGDRQPDGVRSCTHLQTRLLSPRHHPSCPPTRSAPDIVSPPAT